MDNNISNKSIIPASQKGKISDKILISNQIIEDNKKNNEIDSENINLSIKKNSPKNIKLPKKKKKKNRCSHPDCKRKLGIVDWNCKCNLKFCNKHRFPCDHNCTYDWYNDKKNILDKELMEGKCDFKKIDIL